MNKFGFVKVAAAIPEVKVADCDFNAKAIEEQIIIADGKGVSIVVFPELAITAYTCGDLFLQQLLLQRAEMSLMQIVNNTRQLDIISIVGIPVAVGACVVNGAAVIQKGKILGLVPKTYLPNYNEYYEDRWFTSALEIEEKAIRLCGQTVLMSQQMLFSTPTTCFGVEICEDVWTVIPPSSTLALKGAEIIFNLSADNETLGKHAYLRSLLSQQSAKSLVGYVFSSCGFGESSTDIVFGGSALIYENGTLLNTAKRFSLEKQLVVSEIDVETIRYERRENQSFAANAANCSAKEMVRISTDSINEKDGSLTRAIDPQPFIPKEMSVDDACNEIFSIQTAGLAKRLQHTNCKKVVIGISGGLDSTLALLVCVKTFDLLNLSRKGIIGVTMPGFGTTNRTYQNAIAMMQSLGITIKEISIKEACIQHFKDLEHDINVHDTTYENGQARERTQLLMDLANKHFGMVIGTGDLSELALGWATYNGDHMSMYGVNCSVPKTLIQHVVKWVASKEEDEATKATLLDVVDTPISPELIPATEAGDIQQKTEDLVGPYELHDFFLYHFLRFGSRPSKIYFLAQVAFANKYEDETIKKWITIFFRRFFAQQFKRSCLPDGPKVGAISLSPRGDWRMPSDACSTIWLDECKALV
ncbi:MAG: NAD(+) synthase [Bacteroidaceae bacterium]